MFSKTKTIKSTDDCCSKTELLRKALDESEAVLIGAGSGLSASAGFVYSGDRLHRYFFDFVKKYRFSDMYSGGFYPYSTLEEHWAYWSRYIYINRYMNAPLPVYEQLYELVKEKNTFVLTTNVDHCFQKAGFDKQRLFYTQGDYGLFQCSEPCHQATYENEELIKKMVQAQGFVIKENGDLILPEGIQPKRMIPSELIPYCPRCGKPMSMNLRADQTFVEDEGWHQAKEQYLHFLESHLHQKILFLELGVGGNTPGIIKYPFWQMTVQNPNAVYACINDGEAFVPKQIASQSICINDDIKEILKQITFQ